MDKYICETCGYLYDDEKESPDNRVACGIFSIGIPDDWICPICGSDIEAFVKE